MNEQQINQALNRFIKGTMRGEEYLALSRHYVERFAAKRVSAALAARHCTLDDLAEAFENTLMYLQKSAAVASGGVDSHDWKTTFEIKFRCSISEIFRSGQSATFFKRIKDLLLDSQQFVMAGPVSGGTIAWDMQLWQKNGAQAQWQRATDKQLDHLQQIAPSFAQLGIVQREAKDNAIRKSALVSGEELLVYMQKLFDCLAHTFSEPIALSAGEINRVVTQKLWINSTICSFDDYTETETGPVPQENENRIDSSGLGARARFAHEALKIECALQAVIDKANREISSGANKRPTLLSLWLLYIQIREAMSDCKQPGKWKTLQHRITGTGVVQELALYPAVPQFGHTQLDKYINGLDTFVKNMFGEDFQDLYINYVIADIMLDTLEHFFEHFRCTPV